MNKEYLEAMLTILNEVEYKGEYEEPEYDWDETPIESSHYACCPVCEAFSGEEHYENCELESLIKQPEELLNVFRNCI